MSAPDTNIEKQAERHVGSLFGMGSVFALVAVLFLGFLVWTSYQAGQPAATTPAQTISND